MNLFSFTNLTCMLSCFILGIIALRFARTPIHRILATFNFSCTIWGGGCFLVGIAQSPEASLMGWKIAHMGGFLVGPFFYLLTCQFCGLERRRMLILAFTQGALFSLLSIGTNLMFNQTRLAYGLFYNQANLLLIAGKAGYLFFVILSYITLIKFINTDNSYKKQQAQYIVFGFLFGFIGGTSVFLSEFGIDIAYPAGNLGITIYSFILTYVILRYNLLDLSVVITRASIFVGVYSLVIGIPFTLAFAMQELLKILFGANWWMTPFFVLTALASVGPYIYSHIQRYVESRLLQEQRQHHEALNKSSRRIGNIENLNDLLSYLVQVITRTVGVEHCKIYLLNENTGKYVLRLPLGNLNGVKYKKEVSYRSLLVAHLSQKGEPTVYDKLIYLIENCAETSLQPLKEEMEDLQAHLVLPCLIKGKLIAFISIGRLQTGNLFNRDELTTLSVFANQAALGLENVARYKRY
ncbi:histidine kinase N-terminal 7TM domain-containing protein [Candidatus Omnitrophota bacterium]